MKYTYLLPLLAAAAMMSITGCKNHENSELAHHHHHDHEGHNHDHEGHEHEHEGHEHEHEHEGHPAGVIELQPEIARRWGVHSTAAAEGTVGGVIKVSGTIELAAGGVAVVPAPRAGIVTLASGVSTGSEVSRGATVATIAPGNVSGSTADEIARAELDAARIEYERLKGLYDSRLITLTRYNEARAAYERARAAYSAPAASGRAAAPIGGIVTAIDAPTGSYVEAGAPIASIADADGMTLRANVPARYASRLDGVSDARIVVAGCDSAITLSAIGGRRLGTSTAAAASGYIPVSFSLPAVTGLVPGMPVEVYLLGRGTSRAVTVPRSALYEQQGEYCVFVQLDDDCYIKQPVVPGESDGLTVAIVSGLKAGDRVVDRGVTTVRLAGASGAIPEGHSHQH